MSVAVEQAQLASGVQAVLISGDIDLYTVSELRFTLAEVIEAGANTVLVDLSGATLIDSQTLGVLVAGARVLGARGDRIAVAVRDANIRRVFEVTLLDQALGVFESVDEALEHLAQPA